VLQCLSEAIQKKRHSGNIAAFNDAPQTTHQDILDIFDEAILMKLNGEKV
jgi:hypothetical protein